MPCARAADHFGMTDRERSHADLPTAVIVEELLHLNLLNHGKLFRSLKRRISRGPETGSILNRFHQWIAHCGGARRTGLPLQRDMRGVKAL